MSPTKEIESICFRPPLAIGRVGGSDTPLDAFAWDTDRTIHGSTSHDYSAGDVAPETRAKIS
jgi:hypothetical protein